MACNGTAPARSSPGTQLFYAHVGNVSCRRIRDRGLCTQIARVRRKTIEKRAAVGKVPAWISRGGTQAGVVGYFCQQCSDRVDRGRRPTTAVSSPLISAAAGSSTCASTVSTTVSTPSGAAGQRGPGGVCNERGDWKRRRMSHRGGERIIR